MPLKLEDKQAIVNEVAEFAKQAHSIIAIEYRGMTVAEITQLRAQARQNGVYLRVIKNTLAKRAIANTAFECLQERLVGPILLAFSREEPGAAARVISHFAKTNPKVVVKGIALSRQLLTAADLDKVAKLPTYREAMGMLLAVMQAPVTKLVRTLAEPPAKLARTLAAIRDSKPQ
ncbi:50S ribosomal protein L10 [Thioploca ingrica]|uniref:Large ribosomal subunit protein uL10 n=1 Tax=Thioploca ingrica TaxID=40754 RepID=A0A090BVK7_9GAMM|nr:50S ribosomal protein L10 [Thioploca ingrica]